MSDLDGVSQLQARKTILYIHHGIGLGGAPLSLIYVIQCLDKTRYHPVVVGLHDSEVIPLFRQQGIEVYVDVGLSDFQHTTGGWYPLYSPLGLWGLVRALVHFLPTVWRARAVIQDHNADLVHLNSLSLAPVALGAWMAGVPLVWHVREAVVKGHFGIRRWLLQRLVDQLADEAIFICRDNRHRLGVQRKGVVIYNFVDFQRFDRMLPGEHVRVELGLPCEAKVVLLLGGVSRIKGTLELIQAMDRVRRRVPEAVAVIAGSGPPDSTQGPLLARLASRLGYVRYCDRVQRAVNQYGLNQGVHFLPFRSDVERLIAAADVVVFPSTQPHFARPVIEAGAMAKPVVASRVGGVEEVVQDGKTGLLVPPGNVEALSKALTQVLTDSTLAASLGEGGYRQARRLFDAEINGRQTAKVYERVLLDKTETASMGSDYG